MTWTPDAILALRRACGDSQTAFGKRIGVRQATVSDWERGVSHPDTMARRALDRAARSVKRSSTAAT